MIKQAQLRGFSRNLFIGAAGVASACVPWVFAAEAFGWSQRPAHLLQSFFAIPVAFLSSAWFLCLRTPEVAPAWERRAAWVILLLSGAWLAVIVTVFLALSKGMFPEPA